MSEALQIWLAAFTLVGSVWGSYIGYMQQKLKNRQDFTNEILIEMRRIFEGRYLTQMKITHESLDRIAKLTGEPTDIAAAEIAKRAFLDRAQLVLSGDPDES